jgi:hypothetical protein
MFRYCGEESPGPEEVGLRAPERNAQHPAGLRLILLAPETTPRDLISALRAHGFATFSAPYNASEVIAMIGGAIVERAWKGGIEVLSVSDNWIAFRITPRRVNADRLVRFIAELRLDCPVPEKRASSRRSGKSCSTRWMK